MGQLWDGHSRVCKPEVSTLWISCEQKEKRLVEMFRENRPAEKTRGLGKALGNTVREQRIIALK